MDDWWGYSKQHGWVVLNRSLSPNQSGAGELIFFSWRDLTNVKIERKTWNEQFIIHAPQYIAQFSSSEKAEELESLKARWPEIKEKTTREAKESLLAIEQKKAEENRRRFLEGIGKPYGNDSAPASNKPHRTANCFSCKKNLDNLKNPECTACGWIVCNCGACGCDFHN
jgi:hypothetical protein